MAADGRLVLVVGPSGAGKDTLLAGARSCLAGDPRFVFVQRVVTRAADVAAEDHASMSRTDFLAAEKAGDFALSWCAHDLHYGLPIELADDIEVGRIAIANGSRQVVGEAMVRYPGARIILITADAALRAKRLAARGRESEAQIAARLAREGAPLPEAVGASIVDNSGTPQEGIAALVAALRQAAGCGIEPL